MSEKSKGGRPPAAPGARRVGVPVRLPEWLVAWIDSKGATRAAVIEDACVAALNKERAAPRDERAAFEVWWAAERQRTWIAAGCDKDRGREPAAEWAAGFKEHAWHGWNARGLQAP